MQFTRGFRRGGISNTNKRITNNYLIQKGMTSMLKNLGKSFRKSYNYIKYVVFLGKKELPNIMK